MITYIYKDIIAAEVEKRSGRKIELGRLNWHADSYHIYGKDIGDAEKRLFERIDSGKFEERVYNFNDPAIKEIYDEAEESIKEKIKNYDKEHEGK